MSNLFDLLDERERENGTEEKQQDKKMGGRPVMIPQATPPQSMFKCVECKEDIHTLMMSHRYPDVCILCCYLVDKYDYS